MSNKVRVRYLREKSFAVIVDGKPIKHRGFPVACLATLIDREQNLIKFGISVFNKENEPTNSYSKNYARESAMSNLENNPFSINEKVPDSFADIQKLVFSRIVDVAHIPTRAKKAAKRWLAAHA